MTTKIYSGSNATTYLKDCRCQRALVICDPFIVISGMINKVTSILSEANSSYQIFSEIVPDPTIEVVTKGVAYAADFQPDTIIALGGGSALDTAKAVSTNLSTGRDRISCAINLYTNNEWYW